VLYWLPLALLIILVMASGAWSIRFWPPVFKIYLPGLAMVGYMTKFGLFFFLVLADILAFVRGSVKIILGEGRSKGVFFHRWQPFLIAGVSLASIIFILLFTGLVYWVYDFKIKTVTIESSDVPAEFDGMRIVQISDIHLGNWICARPLNRAIEIINNLKPDVVLFTGDMVNFSTDEAYPFREELRKITAPSGIYAIKGNHDYSDYVQWPSVIEKQADQDSLASFYSQLGWNLMNNRHVILRKGNSSLAIAGIENWSKKALWGRRGNLKEALAGTDSIPFIILMSHDPTHWEAEVSRRYPQVDLTLSGHTHGMQIGIETDSFRWSPAQYIYTYWAGLYPKKLKNGNDQFLYVNQGLGTIGFPGRVGIRPEITLLILKKK
jgi:predicted MPP superfamily phosphohydrolase